MLTLDRVTLGYNGQPPVLREVSLALQQGQVGSLLGKSGSGKTSLLRAVAGFEALRGGAVSMQGEVLSSAARMVLPERRGMGMVFQDGALFPHLSAAGNIRFSLPSGSAATGRCQELAQLLNLQGLLDKFPHELSGGEQQRVALARALASPPRLLLLDEPFSSQDLYMREQLACRLRQLCRQEGITVLMACHDQQEAFAISDFLGVMSQGRLLQWDAPHTVYHEPLDEYVARFVGEGEFIAGEALDQRSVRTVLGDFAGEPHGFAAGDMVRVLLRPDDVLHDDDSDMQAKVVDKIYRGAEFLYTLELNSGERIFSLVPSHHDHAVGFPIGIRMELDHLVVFSGARRDAAAT